MLNKKGSAFLLPSEAKKARRRKHLTLGIIVLGIVALVILG